MSAEKGYLYCLISPALEGLVKVGVTTKHPLERTRELSAPSGVPTPFILAYHRHIQFPFHAEAAIHQQLYSYRVNDSREFFRIPLHKVVEMMERYDVVEEDPEEIEVEYGEGETVATPWAELFNTFPNDGSERELTEEEQKKCRELEQKLRQ